MVSEARGRLVAPSKVRNIRIISGTLRNLVHVLTNLYRYFTRRMLRFIYYRISTFHLREVRMDLFDLFIEDSTIRVNACPFRSFFLIHYISLSIRRRSWVDDRSFLRAFRRSLNRRGIRNQGYLSSILFVLIHLRGSNDRYDMALSKLQHASTSILNIGSTFRRVVWIVLCTNDHLYKVVVRIIGVCIARLVHFYVFFEGGVFMHVILNSF